MAKLIRARALGLFVSVMALTGIVSLMVEAYSLQEAYLSQEEQEQLREQRYADLGHGAVPDPETLKASLDEVMAEHNDSMKCMSDTALKDSKKSTDKEIKSLRGTGDVKKQFDPAETFGSSPCSDTMKKELANQARFGAQTAGLSEGKNGAQTQANLPGSVNQVALSGQNRLKQLELTLEERNQVGPAFNRFCEESPDCETTAEIPRGWLVPVAVASVSGSANFRNFDAYLASETAAASSAMANATRTQERMVTQLASYDQYYQLSQLLETQMAKQQEINAKAEVIKQAALQLEIKMDQGGTSHNCSSVAQKPALWAWLKSDNTCSA